jgi:hypothetical protein
VRGETVVAAMRPVEESASTGVCIVTVYPHQRYNVFRVMTALVDAHEQDAQVDVSAHVDVDDALAAIGSFLYDFCQPHRSAE